MQNWRTPIREPNDNDELRREDRFKRPASDNSPPGGESNHPKIQKRIVRRCIHKGFPLLLQDIEDYDNPPGRASSSSRGSPGDRRPVCVICGNWATKQCSECGLYYCSIRCFEEQDNVVYTSPEPTEDDPPSTSQGRRRTVTFAAEDFSISSSTSSMATPLHTIFMNRNLDESRDTDSESNITFDISSETGSQDNTRPE